MDTGNLCQDRNHYTAYNNIFVTLQNRVKPHYRWVSCTDPWEKTTHYQRLKLQSRGCLWTPKWDGSTIGLSEEQGKLQSKSILDHHSMFALDVLRCHPQGNLSDSQSVNMRHLLCSYASLRGWSSTPAQYVNIVLTLLHQSWLVLTTCFLIAQQHLLGCWI